MVNVSLFLCVQNGDTALHIAAALKRRKIAKILVESHVDIHLKNKVESLSPTSFSFGLELVLGF